MAQQTLKVNLSSVIRPVTHCASGSLYGVTETLPSDIANLVAPLKPCMFTQPAISGSGHQQPIGGSIAVSGRLASTTGKVMIRLADINAGWPYNWPGQSSWLSQVTSIINSKKASGRDNYYGYEIWNEPEGTWKTASGDFNSVCWKPTYDLIRSLDPQAKIIGPSYSYYNSNSMKTFLTYCKNNNCLPDIICWHQWGSGGFSNAIDNYRALEISLGISPRAVSINEYSSDTHTLEGCPGVSVPFISKFERKKVESACISWWFTNLPGRLGSLLTSSNQKGGGWWLYKWYGDMTGNMVSVTPPNDNSDGIDGFACLDLNANYASICLGGNYTGSVNVPVSGIPGAFGSKVDVKLEYVSWANKDTPVSGTTNISTTSYTVSNGTITVPVNVTNPLYAYRIYITPSVVANPVPVVSITAPTNNTVYTEGDNVTINATATITTGSISKVDFYNGTTLLGTDASSPYTYTISAAAAGNYVITAKATSALNAATTSTAVNIQVAKPIYQTGSAPVIDGTIDALWSNFNSVSIAKNNTGTVSSTADLSGNWKAAWDATNLYVLVQVTDDVKRNDAGTDVYNDDGVEVYIDMGNSKATTYGTNDQQYTFRWNDATAAYEINGHSVTGITKGITNTTIGYIVEVSIPWSTMGGTASVNAIEGFEVMISDDDDGAARDGKLAWAATTDDTWSNPSLMGTVILKGLNCTAPTAAITTTTSATFCAGGSVVLNAPKGTGYSYVWKNGTTTITGATAQTYTATTAGTYTVTITNSGGCSATSTATAVTVNALPTITQYAQIDGGAWNQVSTGTVCAGSTVVLGPQPTVTTGWSWTGPNGYSATTREITLASVTPTQGGVYTATYTDGNTCKATSTFTVTVNAAPTAAITTPTAAITTPTATTFCAGGSVVLTASAGSSYKWMNGTTAITGATAQSYTATTAGSYTVEVTNAGNCKATSAATTVTVNAAPTAAITTTTPTTFCAGGSVVLTASTGSSYVWKNGTTQVGTNQTYTATTAGSYTVEVTNAGNCKATSSATTVTVNAAPTAAITTTTATTFCAGGSVVLTASTGSSYVWKNGTTQVGTNATYTATAAGSYTVEVTNAGNCKATSAATTVTVNAAPTAAITTTTATTFCAGGSVVLTASSGSSYKWMNGTTQVGTNQTYTATTAGSYTVEVTNAGNCKATSTATTVTVNAAPTATITANVSTSIPQGGSVVLTANTGSGFTYKWFKGTVQVGTAQTYTATDAGVYTVEVTNANNCSATSSGTNVNINTNQPSVITITSPVANTTVQGTITIAADVTDPDGTIVAVEFLDGNMVIGTSTTAPYSFDWSNPGQGSHTITVRVTDSNGGVTTSAPVTITAEAITTGVQSSNTLNANIYPNPSNGIVFIDSDTDLSGASCMLVDVMGREMQLESTLTGSGAMVDVSNLSAGTYVLIIKKDNSVMRKKITVIR